MPVALRSRNLSSPDLLMLGLYDDVLPVALAMANEWHIDPSHHLYHLVLLLRDVLNLGYKIAELASISNDPVLILFDCPSRRMLSFISARFSPQNVILVLAEHPNYQPSHMLELMRQSSHVIHSYVLPRNYLPRTSSLTTTSFVYKNIQRVERNCDAFIANEYDASIICSDLIRKRPSLYAYRRHLINSASETFGSKFAHFGRGWKPNPQKNQFSLSLLRSELSKNFKSFMYKYPSIDLSRYCGAPKSKNVLFSCRTTFAVENFLEPSGYTTEKPLECLSYGTMPIYVGPLTGNWLSSFFPVRSLDTIQLFSDAISYSNMDSSRRDAKVDKIRNSINDYLNNNGITSFTRLYELISDFQH